MASNFPPVMIYLKDTIQWGHPSFAFPCAWDSLEVGHLTGDTSATRVTQQREGMKLHEKQVSLTWVSGAIL